MFFRMVRFVCLSFLGAPFLAAAVPTTPNDQQSFPSKVLNEKRPIWVALPFDYHHHPDKRYPVILVLDGETQFNMAAGVVDWLANGADAIPQHILIGIANTPGNRNQDLVSLPQQEQRNQAFTRFFVEELIPFVDQTWRTQHFRILVGHSLAGLFTLQMLSEQPQYFGGYLIASPYFSINRGAHITKLAEAFSAFPAKHRFVFASMGDEPGLQEDFEKWSAMMAAKAPKNLIWTQRNLPGETHLTTPVPTLHAGLKALYADLELAIDSDVFKGGVAAIKAYYQTLSETKYGYPVSAEKALNQAALMMAQNGDLASAVEVLGELVKTYSHSWRAQLSLSRVLEASQKWEASLQAATAALALAKGENASLRHFLAQRVARMESRVAEAKD